MGEYQLVLHDRSCSCQYEILLSSFYPALGDCQNSLPSIFCAPVMPEAGFEAQATEMLIHILRNRPLHRPSQIKPIKPIDILQCINYFRVIWIALTVRI